MPETPDAPVIQSPPARKPRIPIWLRWVIGIPLALIALVLIAMPPQRPVNLNGWTPGCPQLEAEEWREGTVQTAALAKIGDYRDEISNSDWMHVGDVLWLRSHKPWAHSGNVILTALTTTGSQALKIENALIDEGSSCPQSEVWMDGERVWMLVGTPVVARETRWYLAAYNIATLTEVQRVPLAMPASATFQSRSLEIARIASPAEGPWLFAVRMRVYTWQGAPKDRDFGFLTQFDPQSATFGPVVELSDPGPPPGSQAAQRSLFQLWTEQGRVPAGYSSETACWHVDATEFPIVQLIPSVHATIPVPPGWSRPPGSPGATGWKNGEMTAHACLPYGVRVTQKYQEFQLDHLAKTTLQADYDRKTLLAQSQPQQALMRRRMDIYNGAASLLYEPDQLLQEHYQQGALRLNDASMELPWASGPTPLPSEFEQSLRASLMHTQWLTGGVPFATMPVLWLYPLDLNTTLVMQLVVSEKGAAGFPAGVLRIGRLAAPSTTIDWIGYAPLPNSFAEYRHRYRLAAYAETGAWMIGLTALKPDGADAVIGAWWTRIDYPAGYLPPAIGWLSQDLPPTLQPWREPDPNATPVPMPIPKAATDSRVAHE